MREQAKWASVNAGVVIMLILALVHASGLFTAVSRFIIVLVVVLDAMAFTFIKAKVSGNLGLGCPAGFFKNSVDRLEECTGKCPAGTTSLTGAASITECFCEGDAIDANSAPDQFLCANLADLSHISSNSTPQVASNVAPVHSFNGSLVVLDASTEELLEEIRELISTLLQISTGTRASLTLEVGDVRDWRLDFEIVSSDPELAAEMQSKLHAEPFAAWVYTEMSTTELASANLTRLTEVEMSALECPNGLGFQPGAVVTSLADCKCPHGKQPAADGSTGLLAGCVSCPYGTYKSTVGDTSCLACPTLEFPLTTLQLGAISIAACTCSAGYTTDWEKGGCTTCGDGYFCLGGTHREACSESRTTISEMSGSDSDCVCSDGTFLNATGQCEQCMPGQFKEDVGNAPCQDCEAGTYSSAGADSCNDCDAGRFSAQGAATCEPCPAGRYSLDSKATSLDSCVQCGIGTWSTDLGADTDGTCRLCKGGSTTEQTGSANETACVRPHSKQERQCVSGRVCTVDNITGYGLRAGHRLGISSADCKSAKVSVEGIENDGISKVSDSGSQYVWGDQPEDFTPGGGFYNMCWCANMESLVCTDLNANYLIKAGRLLVAGPSDNFFRCVRGRDCIDLWPFAGFELEATDLVAVRRDACGTTAVTEISTSNTEGVGTLSNLQKLDGAVTNLALGFGVSDETSMYDLSIDADQSGYFLCWCASGRGVVNACSSPEEFNVYAGRLSVVGPRTNQESGCSIGQPCAVPGILGALLESGDRLMVLSDCGRGVSLPGFPSSGIMETNNSKDFGFVGNGSDILLSSPGIFRLCFCRPGDGETCESPKSFRAKVGLMTASGPFEQTTVCYTGSNCTVLVTGIGLQAGDQVFIANGECGEAAGMGARGFPRLDLSISVMETANGLEASLGELPQGHGIVECGSPYSGTKTV